MKEVFITEKELDYFTNIPQTVCEEPTRINQLSFEEESKGCITLEEFSKLWEESINRLIPKR